MQDLLEKRKKGHNAFRTAAKIHFSIKNILGHFKDCIIPVLSMWVSSTGMVSDSDYWGQSQALKGVYMFSQFSHVCQDFLLVSSHVVLHL